METKNETKSINFDGEGGPNYESSEQNKYVLLVILIGLIIGYGLFIVYLLRRRHVNYVNEQARRNYSRRRNRPVEFPLINRAHEYRARMADLAPRHQPARLLLRTPMSDPELEARKKEYHKRPRMEKIIETASGMLAKPRFETAVEDIGTEIRPLGTENKEDKGKPIKSWQTGLLHLPSSPTSIIVTAPTLASRLGAEKPNCCSPFLRTPLSDPELEARKQEYHKRARMEKMPGTASGMLPKPRFETAVEHTGQSLGTANKEDKGKPIQFWQTGLLHLPNTPTSIIVTAPALASRSAAKKPKFCAPFLRIPMSDPELEARKQGYHKIARREKVPGAASRILAKRRFKSAVKGIGQRLGTANKEDEGKPIESWKKCLLQLPSTPTSILVTAPALAPKLRAEELSQYSWFDIRVL